jgi:hypothetical protein
MLGLFGLLISTAQMYPQKFIISYITCIANWHDLLVITYIALFRKVKLLPQFSWNKKVVTV